MSLYHYSGLINQAQFKKELGENLGIVNPFTPSGGCPRATTGLELRGASLSIRPVPRGEVIYVWRGGIIRLLAYP